MRRSLSELFWELVQYGEKRLLRVIVLGCILIFIVQLHSATNPLQTYLAFVQNIEENPSPYFPVSTKESSTAPNAGQTQGTLYQITLRAQPAVAIKVSQNGKTLGTLGQGELQLSVQAGVLQLDGREVDQTVKVQVTNLDPGLHEPLFNQTFIVQGNLQTIRVE